jgi:putative sterol carrier protein
MPDLATEFFEQLAVRGHEPALGKITGTLRFDLKEEGKRTVRWLVAIRKGDIEVTRGNAAADCIVRLDRVLLEAIVAGQTNAMASFLRGAVELEGERGLVLAFQRVLSPQPRPRP